MVFISQLIHFARASLHFSDFNRRNKFLTAMLLKQGYQYHKLCIAFSIFKEILYNGEVDACFPCKDTHSVQQFLSGMKSSISS